MTNNRYGSIGARIAAQNEEDATLNADAIRREYAQQTEYERVVAIINDLNNHASSDLRITLSDYFEVFIA